MATINDIVSFTIDEQGPTSGVLSAPIIDVNIVATPQVDIISVPEALSPEMIEIDVPGLQGPPGLQNVFVGPTPPPNPQDGWVWIDTS